MRWRSARFRRRERAAWDKARFLSFTFVVERNGQVAASFPQQWDRVTGNYRVSGVDPKGVPFTVVLNTKTKTGRAWQKGVEVTDLPALKELLALGYRRYNNDTYWLLMPLKMLEPGVHRTSQGERTDAAGHKWDVVRLTFDPASRSPTSSGRGSIARAASSTNGTWSPGRGDDRSVRGGVLPRFQTRGGSVDLDCGAR